MARSLSLISFAEDSRFSIPPAISCRWAAVLPGRRSSPSRAGSSVGAGVTVRWGPGLAQMYVLALVLAEALAMVLTWRDPVLSSAADRTLTSLAWPGVAALAIWRGLDAGLSLQTVSVMGALVVFAACVFTAGQPGVLFLTTRVKGRVDQSRLWRRIVGYVGVVAACVAAGFWVVVAEGALV